MRSEVNATSSSSNMNATCFGARKIPAPVKGPLAPPQPQPVAREPDRKPPLGLPHVTLATNLDCNRSATSNPPDRPRVQSNIVAAPPPPPVAAPVEEPLPDDPDESFHFYSDDDAFLAGVDLGEGDLGQPVLSETDLGRPIGGEDGDSDLGRAIDVEEGLSGDSTKFSPSGHHHAERPMGPQDRSFTSLGMLSRLLPQNQNPNQQQAQLQRVSAQPGNTSRKNQSLGTGRPPNLAHQRNENKRPPVPASNSSSSTKRPTTPSMGGFNFPPGVASLWLRILTLFNLAPQDPRQLQAQSKPMLFSAQGSTSGIGQKRPLDAMYAQTLPSSSLY